jgi:hypothetical protein
MDIKFGNIKSKISTFSVEISAIDNFNAIVYLKYDAQYQVEVYKYTRHRNGLHYKTDGKYDIPHFGKRYKVIYQLKQKAKEWKIPDRWFGTNTKSYFKFGLYNPSNHERSLSITSQTIETVVNEQFMQSTKILLKG